MKARKAALAALLVAALAAAPALALQEMTPPKPGKEHEFLKQFEGEWESTAKFVMAPGQEPMVSKGKETCRLIAGGLFLVIDTDAEMMGEKFVGHGTLGYDVLRKKYTGSWIDSTATGVYLVEGTVDEKAKVFTEWMEGADPRTGKPLKLRMVHEIKDKDSRVLTFSMPGPDGKETQTGTIEYKRKK